MYAYPDDRFVRIHLANGENRECVATMLNFCATLGFDIDYSARGTTKLDIGYIRVSESGLLAMIGCSAVINLKYVDKISFFQLSMIDGHKIKFRPPAERRYAPWFPKSEQISKKGYPADIRYQSADSLSCCFLIPQCFILQ